MITYGKGFKKLLDKAKNSPKYWVEKISLDFSTSLNKVMGQQDVSSSELARRIESSPAYITKVLKGDTNFTVETLVKLTMALDSEVEITIKPKATENNWVPLDLPSNVLKFRQPKINYSPVQVDFPQVRCN